MEDIIKNLSINRDAFSNGQIDSKIWLCEQLEKLFSTIDSIWIYGGWYGLTAFLIKSRNNIGIKTIRSYDLDPKCEKIADMINENWVIKEWQFKAFTEDCNDLEPKDIDLIINTSTEHFESMDWYYKIPKGTVIAVQGNNMLHEDHISHSETLSDFVRLFPVAQTLYTGTKEFKYPNWSFTRFMLIGIK